MSGPLIECVPNFSEGRDLALVKQITDQIESVEGVWLLDVDPGKATNRTVVTFVGPPEPVLEAAVRAARKAAELIDMRKHKGEHPRFGALDVCPLVPVANITMEETVGWAGIYISTTAGTTLTLDGIEVENNASNLGARRDQARGLVNSLTLLKLQLESGRAPTTDSAGSASVVAARAANQGFRTHSSEPPTAVAPHVAGPRGIRGRVEHGPLTEQAEDLSDLVVGHRHVGNSTVVS